MSENKKRNYVDFGSIIYASEYDDEGNRLDGEYKHDADGRKVYRIRLNKNTKVVIDGVDMTGKTLYVDHPLNKYKRMLEKGTITKKEFEKREQQFSNGGELEYVRFEISAKVRDE